MPFVAQPQEKCVACNRTVFVTEKIIVEEKEQKKTLHKTCLRCVTCNQTLSLGNYSALEGNFYCKPHFKQLFATKGNYDEAFGKEKATNKWDASNNVVIPGGNKSFIPQEESKVEKSQQTSEATVAKFKKFREEGDSNKCEVCDKTVYLAEKLLVEDRQGKRLFHKACFKCSVCNIILDLRNYGSLDGKIFCKNHLKEAQQAQLKEKTGNAYVPTTSNTFVPETSEEKKTEKGETPDHIASKFKGLGSSEKCKACNKSVYVTERIVVEELNTRTPYHKNCLKCSHCNIGLDLSTYGSSNGVIYCKVHLKTVAAPEMAKVAMDLDNPLTGLRRVENVEKPSLVPVNRDGGSADSDNEQPSSHRQQQPQSHQDSPSNSRNSSYRDEEEEREPQQQEQQQQQEEEEEEETRAPQEPEEQQESRRDEPEQEPEQEQEQQSSESSSSAAVDSEEDEVARRRRLREQQEQAEEEERQRKLEERRREREERKKRADEEAAREEEERKRRQEERRRRLESSEDN